MTPQEARAMTGHGWKFLDPTGCTYRNGMPFQYDLPRRGEKWGPWQAHPEPAEYDGRDCGPGRIHVMRHLSAQYAPHNWWPWFVEWRGMVGESIEKLGVVELRLRRVAPVVFYRYIMLGFCAGANLRGANLRGANLRGADLSGADLSEANLRGANLYGANLRGADLSGADLSEANLRGANLYGADLRGANLYGADLSEANLYGANLYGANLRGANLRGADLSGANLREADLRGADLSGANLREADLYGAIGYTQ